MSEPNGTDNIDPNEIFRMRCAACQEVIGLGNRSEAKRIATEHAKVCTASKEDYLKAVTDLRFKEMVDKLEQEWEEQ